MNSTKNRYQDLYMKVVLKMLIMGIDFLRHETKRDLTTASGMATYNSNSTFVFSILTKIIGYFNVCHWSRSVDDKITMIFIITVFLTPTFNFDLHQSICLQLS